MRRGPNRFPEYRYEERDQPVAFTFCTAHRRPFLAARRFAQIVIDAILSGEAVHGVHVIAYCVMPDHVHILLAAVEEGANVKRYIDSLKRVTSRRLREAGLTGRPWQRDYLDRHTRSASDLNTRIAYILDNPVRAGLCDRREEWEFSEYRGLPWES